jgi:hypothetical protein
MKLLLLAIPCLLLATATSATPPDPTTQQQVETLVQTKLLQPLARKDDERSRFSRARMPPAERRARVLETQTDIDGATFVRFAVDVRHGYTPEWRADTIVGCAYLARGDIYVDRTSSGLGTHARDVREASVLLGKKVKPALASTCLAR